MTKPQITRERIEKLLKQKNITEKTLVVGIRGYYLDSMGKPGVNDRGIYDDCMLIIGPQTFITFNANVDPSIYRKGKGKGASKGMATLKCGYYHAHQLGLHRGKYEALIQTGGPVTVIRDGKPDYEDGPGYYGVNLHCGAYKTTSSAGCQTLFPSQWEAFIAVAKNEMRKAHISVMPYLLVEEKDLPA